MMQAWLATGLPIRLAVLGLLGACLGRVVNRLVDAWRCDPQAFRPTHLLDERLRRPLGRWPLLAWLRARPAFARAKRSVVGPLGVELGCAVALPVHYYWVVVSADPWQGLPWQAQAAVPELVGPLTDARLHLAWGLQTALAFWMLLATLLDLAEQVIPDEVTFPGTLLALGLAAAFPLAGLPATEVGGLAPPAVETLSAAFPFAWPRWLQSAPHLTGLVVAWACLWAWCLALWPWRWRLRRGLPFALRLLAAHLRREPITYWSTAAAGLGAIGIFAVWRLGGAAWLGLSSALLGIVVGGGLMWAVRLSASWALRKEALGFGDVTLMAMFGAFLGWQVCLVIFFVAPLAAAVIGLAQWLFRRQNILPYGPFLCLGAVAVLAFWRQVWPGVLPYFVLGDLLLPVAGGSLVLMLVLLAGWRAIAGRS